MIGTLGTRTPSSAETSNAWHSRNYLPHNEAVNLQFITFRLYDSVPRNVIDAWKKEIEYSTQTNKQLNQTAHLSHLVEQYEDMGFGESLLKEECAAEIVENTLLSSDGIQYKLVRYCIMPNHVHVLIEKFSNHTLSNIVKVGNQQAHIV